MVRARANIDVTDPNASVFVISVAAELSGMHPQTLRGYDRLGLVTPGRTGGEAVATRSATSRHCVRWPG